MPFTPSVSMSENTDWILSYHDLWSDPMTTPHERSRALVWAGAFFIEIARDERLPVDVRQQAVRIARHFPTIEQIGHLAATVNSSTSPFRIGLENPSANPEWAGDSKHGSLTSHTRLGWPRVPQERNLPPLGNDGPERTPDNVP